MKNLIFVFVLSIIFFSTQHTHAQLFDKIKKETEKVIQKETQKPPEVKKEAPPTTEEKKDTDTQESTNTTKTSEETISQKPQDNSQFSSSTQYDFVPGDKVIFFDDFSQDAVGDFPALWTANSAGEINTVNIAPGNWFNLNSTDGNYFYLNDIDFPKNFIIEFDIIPKTKGGRIAAGLLLYGESKRKEMDNNPHPGNGGIMISIEKGYWNTWGYKEGVSEKITGNKPRNYLGSGKKIKNLSSRS